MRSLLSSSLIALLAFASAPAAAATWTIDPAHTYAGFAVEHMMVSKVRGAFSDVSGTIELDPANLAATKAKATIQVVSVDTRNDKRDEHLRSPDFFDASKFATIEFQSKSVKNVTKTGFQLVGDLTIRGVTKEVTLDVVGGTTEHKDPWGNVKMGLSATTKLNRKDFGLVWNQTLEAGGMLVGETVEITLDIEAAKAK
jgi:polyisoprenoid-binding protein YceI